MIHLKTNLSMIVIVLGGLVGLWLSGFFQPVPNSEDISALDTVMSVVGVFMLFGAICAFFWIVSRQRKPLSDDEARAWKVVREGGRAPYVIGFMFRILGPFLLVLSALTAYSIYDGGIAADEFMISGALLVAVAGCSWLAAVRSWAYYEHEYEVCREKHRG